MHRPPRALLAIHAAFALALCVLPASGCGGGGGGGGGGGSAATTGAIAGTIVLPDADWGILAEREPNDTLSEAQALPPLEPRSSVVVAGEGGTTAVRYGRVDTTDAFRARYLSTISETLRPNLWPQQRDRITILPSTLGELSQAIGAALVALYRSRG